MPSPVVTDRLGLRKPYAGQNPNFDDIDFTLQRLDDAAEAVFVPCATDASDQTALIESVIADVDPGVILRFPKGPIGLTPITFPKQVGVRGLGRFATRFVDLSGSADPLLTFDTTVDSGEGIWDNYGSSISHIAVDRPEGSGPGLRISPNTAHFRGEQLLVQGGTQSLDIQGGNAHFDDCFLWGATDCFLHILQSGLELDLTNIRMARNTAGNTDAYFKVEISTAGSYGALYMDNVWGNCALGVGGSVTHPFVVTSPLLSLFHAYLRQVALDNCSDAAILTLIAGFRYLDGYVNTAAGSGNAVVKMNGCQNPTFRRNELNGGVGGSTFEFVGAATDSFVAEENLLPTGPLYKISTANKPTNPYLDDIAPAAAVAGNISNDTAWLNSAGGKRWGVQNLQSSLHLSAVPQLASPAANVGTMVAGSVTIDAPGVDAAYSMFIPFVVAPGGTRGSLGVSARNPTGGSGGLGSVTITSTSAGETSTVGYLRFDIPH